MGPLRGNSKHTGHSSMSIQVFVFLEEVGLSSSSLPVDASDCRRRFDAESIEGEAPFVVISSQMGWKQKEIGQLSKHSWPNRNFGFATNATDAH